MKRLTDNELDALESALAKATPGEARLLTNGAMHIHQDASYWGVLGGAGYYGGPGSGGFYLSGFIDQVEARRIVLSYNALPALLAEVRELRRLTTPEPISEKHQDGNWSLVWEPEYEHWFKARWRHEVWDLGWQNLLGTPTHALPLPGRPEPPAARGEE